MSDTEFAEVQRALKIENERALKASAVKVIPKQVDAGPIRRELINLDNIGQRSLKSQAASKNLKRTKV